MKPLAIAPIALLLLTSSASAEPAGHFDPDAVTAGSRLFGAAAAGSQGGVEPLERSLLKTDGALAELELALGLLSGSVDKAQHELWVAKLEARSGVFFGEAEAFQAEVYGMGDAFQAAFQTALERAKVRVGVELIECREPKSALGSLAPPPGLGGKAKAEPTGSQCPGENYSDRLAAAWDEDPELQAEVRKLSAPLDAKVTTYDEKTPVLALNGGPAGSTWIAPGSLASQIPEAQEVLDRLEAEADAARATLMEAKDRMETAEDREELGKAIVARARGIRAWTETQRGALGAVLWASVDRARRKGKKAGWSDVAACANPDLWGSCEGTEVTDEVVEVLFKDKKLGKALQAMLDGLGGPDTTLPE